jgi:Uma2 family endonuclease
MSTVTRVSYDEFEAMIARGDFDVEDPRRYELIDGEIIEMPPPNPPHASAINQINKWSCRTLPPEEVSVSIQNPIGLPNFDAVPMPDVVWLREADYSARRPFPPDILLVVEVSDSSLWYDRGEKAHLYAAAGIADYWIANIQGRCFEVLRDPGPEGYATKLIYYSRDVIRPLAMLDIAFPVSVVFHETGEAEGPNGRRKGAKA